jgi:hypothetical protein
LIVSEGAVETPVQTSIERPGQESGGDSAYQTLVSTLPEGLRGDVNIQRHQSFEELAKEYANLVPAVGRKGVLLPKEDDQNDIARFLGELGRPEDPSGYDRGDFTPPEDLPWDPDVEAKLTQLMHSAGITQGQYDKLLRGYAEMQGEMYKGVIQGAHQDNQEQVAKLQAELGASYEPSVNMAARAMKTIFGESAERVLQHRGADGNVLGNNPDFIKGMIAVSKMLGEDRLLTDASGRGPMAMTPAEAKQKILEKQSDKEFWEAYTNTKHIGHAAANAEMDALYAQAHPEAPGG